MGEVRGLLVEPVLLFHFSMCPGSNSGCQACVAAPSPLGHLASSSVEAFRAQGHPHNTTAQDAGEVCLHTSFSLGPTRCDCAKRVMAQTAQCGSSKSRKKKVLNPSSYP